jgi:hypothetical protein
MIPAVGVAPTGLLKTSDLQSVPALYGDYAGLKADGGSRTHDLLLGKETLCC